VPALPPGYAARVKLGAAFWLNDTDWPSLREAITAAEAAGFDSLWFDDHLLADEGIPSAPKLEGWTVAAAAAALTTRATIGHLVVANTFRTPGLLAKMATTLDHVSEGRAVLGIGAGWFEEEHRAFGLDFGASAGERIDRMGEAVGLIRRLLDGEVVTHDGRFYHLADAVCAPLPVQRPLPLLIGGSGPRKTLPLVARHAGLWNAFGTPEVIRANGALVAEACAAIGRDPSTVEWTVTLNVAVRDDRASAEAAFAAILEHNSPRQHERDLDAAGTPAEVAALLRSYADASIGHAMWLLRPPWDLETIRRVGEVREALGA
jgi:alkanesulfonate monooxygenase SsuD/methylene tetrahydromethanopterin reductase-like flavin-dependent oxidoreductase (luciferase family)